MKILSGLIVILLLASCQTSKKQDGTSVPSTPTVSGTSFPQAQKPVPSLILDKVYFTISYNEQQRLPNWVTYTLSAQRLKNKVAQRQDKFFADPVLIQKKSLYSKPTDYAKSGYDRGHMAPSEDFVWDQEANDTTFIMSNMAPQVPALNRGSWSRLEEATRQWACTEEEVLVIVGPVLSVNEKRLSSGVVIPKRFFKVILDMTPPRKALAFVFSQEDGKKSYEDQVQTVASVESLTGFEFFPQLAVEERSQVSASSNLKAWKKTNCVGQNQKRKKH